ncbi:hypothetical protein [Marinospirillum perlucidum]|uniref:hypothetical protein n=1 Tax=Marinospirillum perlucidum TaxID=1982602 RepID=UPI000DF49D6D|nr:hypothetical protein [Marinospirillum perlucidum]
MNKLNRFLVTAAFSTLAVSSAVASSTQLQYLVELNGEPRGVLMLDISPDHQVQVSNRGLQASDNLPFYAEIKAFSLGQPLSSDFGYTLNSISVNGQDSYSLRYDLSDAEGQDILRRARVPEVDRANRAVILDQQGRPVSNFPVEPVFNTEALLIALGLNEGNNEKRMYFYEPGTNRFLRVFLEGQGRGTLGGDQCEVDQYLLRLDQEGQAEVPLINIMQGESYVREANAASGAWSLKLVAAGEEKQHQVAVEQRIVSMSTQQISRNLGFLNSNPIGMEMSYDQYRVNHRIEGSPDSQLRSQYASARLNANSVSEDVELVNGNYSISFDIGAYCSEILSGLETHISRSLASIPQLNSSDFSYAVSLDEGDNQCSSINLNIEVEGDDPFHYMTMLGSINNVVKSYSMTLLNASEAVVEFPSGKDNDDATLTEEMTLNYSASLAENQLITSVLNEAGVNNRDKINQMSQISFIQGDYIQTSVPESEIITSICQDMGSRLSNINNASITSADVINDQCHFDMTHAINKNSAQSQLIDSFVSEYPHISFLSEQPQLQGNFIVYNGLLGIEGESNACQ